jgi:predicted transglutaminase-like cysteine proteinase
MNIVNRPALLLSMLCLLLAGTHGHAGESDAGGRLFGSKKHFVAEFGTTLPPIGFVNFCARAPEDCRATGKSPKKIKLTPTELTTLYQVNTFVNGRIMPVSDEELYGEAEYWTYPEDAGDCEDMVLLKKKHLTALGFPPEALRITVVLDENMQGHAVLTVTTTEGDFVLDNRVNEIKLWSEVNYVLLKRQSAQDPKSWKSLSRDLAATRQQAEASGSK